MKKSKKIYKIPKIVVYKQPYIGFNGFIYDDFEVEPAEVFNYRAEGF